MSEYNNPVKTKLWIAYLLHIGGREARVDGSHHHWKVPGVFRTITFWGHKKEVPRLHIRTSLRTLGRTNKEFNLWLKNNS